jgi:hypothetical protein
MAVTPVTLFRGAATTTTTTTLYTGPTTGTYIVTNIAVTNTASSAGTFTLAIDGTALFTTVAIAANSTQFVDLKQTVVSTGTAKLITGGASATTVNFHITGVTI